MARPIKTGLDYFPLDINLDDNLELIEAEHGLSGFAIVIKLWQKIYSSGYYTEWNEDTALLFSRKINSEVTLINSVINSCFRRNILDKNLFDKYGILTSSGIQKRFLTVCKAAKRSNVSMIKEYILVNSEFTDIITEITPVNSEFSTQRKEKESKVKESKELTWRSDFEIYKDELRVAFKKLINDPEFIEKQEKFHPGVDIALSLEKACVNFWATEAGWKNKKKKKTKDINWKLTFVNAIDLNKVYKPKNSSGFNPSDTRTQSDMKEFNGNF